MATKPDGIFDAELAKVFIMACHATDTVAVNLQALVDSNGVDCARAVQHFINAKMALAVLEAHGLNNLTESMAAVFEQMLSHLVMATKLDFDTVEQQSMDILKQAFDAGKELVDQPQDGESVH